MNNILENELVRKYFGTIHTGCPDGCGFDHFEASSKRVLDAMQTPILKGERYLTQRSSDQSWAESSEERDFYDFHPYALRLPDRYQPEKKKECDHHAYEKRCTLCPYIEVRTDWMTMDKPAPEPSPLSQQVEEKIKEIRWMPSESCDDQDAIEIKLRELVKLAKGER